MDIKSVDLESVRQLRNIQIVITSLCINQWSEKSKVHLL